MSLSDFKISTKLIVSFAIVAAIGALIGVLATLSMGRMNDVEKGLLDNQVAAMSMIKEANVERLKAVVGLRDAILASDDAERNGAIARLLTGRSKSAEFLGQAEKLNQTDASRESMKAVRGALQKDQEALDTLLAIVKTSEFAPSSDVLQGLKKDMAPVSIKLGGAMSEFSKLKEDEVGATAADNASLFTKARNAIVGLILVGAVVSLALGMGISRHVARPLKYARKSAQQMSEGDMSTLIKVEGKDEIAELLLSMESMRSHLSQIVSRVRSGSEGVAAASSEIAQSNNDLSSRTEHQASSLEETAASMEELSATVKQNADSARQANELAQSASMVAKQGGEVVNQVVETMKGINDSSRKISDIISVIDGIAFQTNILALNAAVEAARAGAQGRGFAVVASEVRSLAVRSAEAAKEIKSLINASVERVEIGTALVDKAGETMTDVVNSIGRVTHIMGEISSASSEQAAGVSQVGEAVTQMDLVTQQNAALVEEMAAAASSLQSQSDDLVKVVASFKLSANETAISTTVRSAASLSKPFKGNERRTMGAAKPKSKPVQVKLAAPKPVQQSKPMAKAKATPAGGDDEWETF